jgi:hypothetical protein
MLAIAMVAHAQAPAFEVASVKANKSATTDDSFDLSHERLTAENTRLGMLIMRAYNIGRPSCPGTRRHFWTATISMPRRSTLSAAELMRMPRRHQQLQLRVAAGVAAPADLLP